MDFKEHTQKVNRERQKRYYDTNKARIALKRKEKRLENRKLLDDDEPEPNDEPVPNDEPETNDKENEIVTPKVTSNVTQQPLNQQVSTTQEAVTNALKTTDYFKEESTRRTNLQQVPLIFRATNNEPLADWIKKPAALVKNIKELKQINGKNKGSLYSITAVPRILGTILNIIKKIMDLSISDEDDKYLFNAYRLSKLEYDILHYKKLHPILNRDTSVKRFDKILREISDKKSIVYLVASLYKYGPVRNDYSNIILIQKKEDMETNKNYMILPIAGNAEAIIQKHKTVKTSGVITIQYPTSVTTLLRNYVKTKKIKYGDRLFGDLKPVLSEITEDREDNQDGGTRTIRRSIASTLYDDYVKGKAKLEDVYKQIKIMSHSPDTHLKYYLYGIL